MMQPGRIAAAGAACIFVKYSNVGRKVLCDTASLQQSVGAPVQSQVQSQVAGKANAPREVSLRSESYAVHEKTIAQLSADMKIGVTTSEEIVRTYLKNIHDLDQSGPKLRSVLCINPNALIDAAERDQERARGFIRGSLHGIPILIKDNIETADPMPTTAGSIALVSNTTGRDAPAVAKLRDAGAVILGKTNLSEWANIRSDRSSSGWSAVGGLTRNPYALDRSPAGSSSGSGVAVAANLAAAAIGTETDGSVTFPAAVSGIVGVKPTVGLVSRRYIVPISHSQDTAGPMARTVEDAACILTAMAGADPLDEATWDAECHRVDYASLLSPFALQGTRIGIARFMSNGWDKVVSQSFEHALEHLRAAGAELVEIEEFSTMSQIAGNEWTVLICELKDDLEQYLADAAPDVPVRTLKEIIAFNERESEREMPFFGQENFVAAEATSGMRTDGYREALDTGRRLAGPEGIDWLLRQHNLDALISPTGCPPWTIDLINGDHVTGSSTMLPAVSGYPHVTVPMGQVCGLPVGLSFIGPRWSEQRLLSFCYAFEKRAQGRRPPTFADRLPDL